MIFLFLSIWGLLNDSSFKKPREHVFGAMTPPKCRKKRSQATYLAAERANVSPRGNVPWGLHRPRTSWSAGLGSEAMVTTPGTQTCWSIVFKCITSFNNTNTCLEEWKKCVCKLMYICRIYIIIYIWHIYLNHFEIFCVNGYCIYQNSTTGMVPVLNGNGKSCPNKSLCLYCNGLGLLKRAFNGSKSMATWRYNWCFRCFTPGKWVKKPVISSKWTPTEPIEKASVMTYLRFVGWTTKCLCRTSKSHGVDNPSPNHFPYEHHHFAILPVLLLEIQFPMFRQFGDLALVINKPRHLDGLRWRRHCQSCHPLHWPTEKWPQLVWFFPSNGEIFFESKRTSQHDFRSEQSTSFIFYWAVRQGGGTNPCPCIIVHPIFRLLIWSKKCIFFSEPIHFGIPTWPTQKLGSFFEQIPISPWTPRTMI